jgi:hypothetical protein
MTQTIVDERTYPSANSDAVDWTRRRSCSSWRLLDAARGFGKSAPRRIIHDASSSGGKPTASRCSQEGVPRWAENTETLIAHASGLVTIRLRAPENRR